MTLLFRRSSELGLLVWVAAIAVTGSVAVAAAETTAFDRSQVAIPILFIALMVVLHTFLAARGIRGDQILLPLAAMLSGLGLVLVQRLASSLLAQQLTWTVIAAGAFAATMLIPRDLTALARSKWTWAILGVALLVSPLLPVIGREVNGARIWIGAGRVSFEPWEAVKLLLVVFFAAYLEEFREVIARPRRFGPFPVPPLPYLLPIIAMWAFAMLVVIFEKDLGASLLFLGIFLAMLYLATGEAFYTLVIVGGNARLIPLTGITLPFVAYGGSSLVTNWMLIGLLMRVSDITARTRGTP